jgi:hypothetical protein
MPPFRARPSMRKDPRVPTIPWLRPRAVPRIKKPMPRRSSVTKTWRRSGPLPRLKMEGTENSDEIIEAIKTYRAKYTAEQTEQAVRIWYERYDEVLAAAIQNNIETRVLRDANTSNGYELCMESRDYQQCNKRQMAEQRGARNDQIQIAKNFNVESRVQQAFMRIRNALLMNNLRYDWFKVRTTNGVDKF